LFLSIGSLIFFFTLKRKNIMARPHHRKKHKEHLQHYQHRREQVAGISKKGKSAWPLAIIGAVGGLLLVMFTMGNNIPAMIGGVIIAGAVGYFIGRKMDNTPGGE
jgi:flagellar motor component MotA